MHTVLEIGSGSYKLCWQEARKHSTGSTTAYFTKKFESSLGKNLIDLETNPEAKRLNPESVKTALSSLDEKIIPFLKTQEIKNSEVLVFATAALRLSMRDPLGSGNQFTEELKSRGFKDIRVFSEAEECLYAAKAVIDELDTGITQKSLESFSILDTGGASHQIIQVINQEPCMYKSFPIGSHTDLSKQKLPDLGTEGFSSQNHSLVILGTTGQILTAAESISRSENLYEEIKKLHLKLKAASIPERKKILEEIIHDEKICELFVEYRLAVMPQAIEIILNAVKFLEPTQILNSSQESIQYIAKAGFHTILENSLEFPTARN